MIRFDALKEEIFNILSATEYGFTVSMYGSDGMTTMTPLKSTWINIKPDNFMLSLPDSEMMSESDVELWKDESNEDEDILKDLILRIKRKCNENGVGFTTKLYSRDTQPKNFSSMIERNREEEELEEGYMKPTNTIRIESFDDLKRKALLSEKMIGTPLRSHYKAGKARMTIHHGHKVNEENVTTGRALNIKKIVIECKGKKYEYPFKHLSGARAMTRHLSEGGKFKDIVGKKICGMSEELSEMYGFIKEYRKNEQVRELVEVAQDRTKSIKQSCKALEGIRNYRKMSKMIQEEKELDKEDMDRAVTYVQSKFGLDEAPKQMTKAIKYISESIIKNMEAFKKVLLKHFVGSDNIGLDRLVDAIDNQELSLKAPLAKATGDNKVEHYTNDIISKLDGELAGIAKDILTSILNSGNIGEPEKEVIKLFGKMPVVKGEISGEDSIEAFESWMNNKIPTTRIDEFTKNKE